jgi:uncharacterized FlgJ-related protein
MSSKHHVGTVTRYERTDWGAKGLVKTGSCEIPFMVPIRCSYLADDIDVGSMIEYGKDPHGSIRLPVFMSLVPAELDDIPHMNTEERQDWLAIKDVIEMMLAASTANNAKLRDLVSKLSLV